MNKNHKNKFKTPEGYFDSFNERLFARIEAEEQEPDTSFLPKTDGFSVPENYFDQVERQILESQNQNTPKVVQLFARKNWYYAAASVVVLVALSLFFFTNTSPELQFDDLASADLELYIDEAELDLSSYELAEYVDIANVSIADITEDDLEEDVLLDYLNENLDTFEDLNLDYDELY